MNLNFIRSRYVTGFLLFTAWAGGHRLRAQEAPSANEPALELKVMTFNIQGGAGGGRGGGAGAPAMSLAQTAAIADLNQQLIAPFAAATQARSAWVATIFAPVRNEATISAKAAELNAAELKLARTRAELLAKVQSGPGRIAQAQVDTLAQQAARGTGPGAQTAWPQRRDVVFDVLKRHAPDLVGTQEAGRVALNEIQQNVPGYGEIGISRDNGLTRGEYVALLYRLDRFVVDEAGTFWLSETPEVAGSRSWDSAYLRIVTWARLIEKATGRAVYFYNTHLDNVSQLARERSAQLMAARIAARKHKDPFVITGDFNAEEPTAVIEFMKGRAPLADAGGVASTIPSPVRDTFRVAHPDQKDVRTRHDWTAERTGEKIDYVFAPPYAEVLEADILYDNASGRYPSDHYPVFARIRLPGGVR